MKQLKPLVPLLKPRIGYAPDDAKGYRQYRMRTEPWQAWYQSRRWRKLRWEILTRDDFTCRYCKRTVADTAQLVCDHVEPHKGDSGRFWNGPFQTLCKPCHDSLKQRSDANLHG